MLDFFNGTNEEIGYIGDEKQALLKHCQKLGVAEK